MRSQYARIREVLAAEDPAHKLTPAEVLTRANAPINQRTKGLVYTIRNQLKTNLKVRRAESHFEALRSLKEVGIIHRERFGFACSSPPELRRWVRDVAVGTKCRGRWYRAKNSNGMLVFSELHGAFTIQFYVGGGCLVSVSRLVQRKIVTWRDVGWLRDRRGGALPRRHRGEVRCQRRLREERRLLESLLSVDGPVGGLGPAPLFPSADRHVKLPPVNIPLYKPDGNRLRTDGSHPHGFEADESVSTALSRKMFDLNLSTHDLAEKAAKGVDPAEVSKAVTEGSVPAIAAMKEQTEAIREQTTAIRKLIGLSNKPPKPPDPRIVS